MTPQSKEVGMEMNRIAEGSGPNSHGQLLLPGALGMDDKPRGDWKPWNGKGV